MNIEDPSVDELVSRFNDLTKRAASVETNKQRVLAELGVLKRNLNADMEACRAAGLDPNRLQEEIKRLKEVVSTKLEVLTADLDAAEKILKPMIKEIEKV